MDNILRLSFHKDPVTLDPQKSGDRVSSALIFLLFRGLTRFEADHSIRCDLAESYYIQNNHKKYVFHLGDHRWSDGTPITAHDFVRSWKRALVPDFPVRATNFFYPLKNAEKAKKGRLSLDKVGVYAPNDHTLVVELEYPCPYFLELTSFCILFPVSETMQEDYLSPVCNGPFLLERWIPGKEILLKKNPLCKSYLPVHIDGIHITIVPNEKEAFNLFEKGELDWIGNPISPLPLSYLPSLLSDKKIKPLAGITCCWFNALQGPFSNVNLRRAFALSIPREKLLEKFLLPNALSAKSFIPSIDPSPKTSFFSQDNIELAKSLFQGLKTRRLHVELAYEACGEFSRIASLLKSYWEELFSVRVHLEPLSFKEFWQGLAQKKFQMSLACYVSQFTNPLSFLQKLEYKNAPTNFSCWENVAYRSLLKQYHKEFDTQKKEKLVERAEAILFREMPLAPIYYSYFAYLQKPYVKNVSISPIGVVQFDRICLDKRDQSFDQETLIAHRG